MLKRIILLMIICLSSCVNQILTTEVILDYEDFGPHAMAYEILGDDWFQWDKHGNSRPQKYPIKVVIYRDIDTKSIEDKYPIDQMSQLDYRYIHYETAIDYLDKHISEDVVPSVTTKLITTKQSLIEKFK